MHQPSLPLADPSTRWSEPSATAKYCIFRCAGQQLALSATATGELRLARSIVPIPASPPPLVGLCYGRGRFLPVIALQDLLQLAPPQPPQSQQPLIVLDSISPWALLVTSVIAVDTLPGGALAAPLPAAAHAVAIGTAWYGDEPVLLLSPDRLLQMTQQMLADRWREPSAASLPAAHRR